MKSAHAFLPLAALALLTACATSSETTSDKLAQASAQAGEGRTCTQRVPTGSNMPVVVCRTAKEAADERALAEEMRQRIQTPKTIGGTSN